jgi:3-hydroxyisobutyrate dehydrogenase-like beta-hydroxyacid dehydrogenase
MNIGFVGLGVMVFPMAGHLQTAAQAGAVKGVLTIMVGGGVHRVCWRVCC